MSKSAQLRLINEVRSAHAALEKTAEAAFREYATQTAFMVMLTKHQVRALLWLDRMGTFTGKPQRDPGVPDLLVSTIRGLQRRGLVTHYYPDRRERHPGTTENGWYYYKLTRVGRLVAELCRVVGETSS